MRLLSGQSSAYITYTKHAFLPIRCTQVLRLRPATFVLCQRNLDAKYNSKPNWNTKHISTLSLPSEKLASQHLKKCVLGTQHNKNSTGSNENIKGFYRNISLALITGWIAYQTYRSDRTRRKFFKFVTTATCDTTPDNCDNTSAIDSFKSKSHKPVKQRKKCGSHKTKVSLSEAIDKARELCIRRKDEVGSPGIVICVSVDGRQVYAEGFGYADLENHTPMRPSSMLRIASISKSVTAAIMARLCDQNLLDLDKPVQHYVPEFPVKEFMGEKVEITVRQLLNHTSGIRSYKTSKDPVAALDKPIHNLIETFNTAATMPFYVAGPERKATTKSTASNIEDRNDITIDVGGKDVYQADGKEFYLTERYASTKDALNLFKDDPLVSKPGARYLYSTLSYTLLAAVVESVTKKPFTETVTETLRTLGLGDTCLDTHEAIVYNRARSYVKTKKGRVMNAPYVDLSYKWAGGGLLSTVEDVVKFGNILLYSAQHKKKDSGVRGFLKSSTVWKFWAPEVKTGKDSAYGLGFEVHPKRESFGMCGQHTFGVGHTGGAVGVSSALFILPRESFTSKKGLKPKDNSQKQGDAAPCGLTNQSKSGSNQAVDFSQSQLCKQTTSKKGVNKRAVPPQGVVVAIIINMIDVSVNDVAQQIARMFADVDVSH
ncbi:serine beta-lactamase-like protein LACTB, mitochondrial [Physella acuta]|uniref:serine beta-lactamase-like protein LACTB, mitochondrial n=1 Tax=Physella acuta TaxID=109671 RepID=UPI0027DD386B|nr:serine beta-lactamase-like protein LACTB, mitochondrial [Physella acuta]